MVRKAFIVLMMLGVITSASSVCAFVHHCGVAIRGAVLNESCAGGTGHTVAHDSERGDTSRVTFPASDGCWCPSIEPGEVRHAVMTLPILSANGYGLVCVEFVPYPEGSSQQPSSVFALHGVVSSSMSPPKLYRLYSSYLI